MSNAITQLAKIIKNKLVRTVNGGAPDSNGNVDLSYMARQDKNNNFTERQTFSQGIARVALSATDDLDAYDQPGFFDQMHDDYISTMKNVPFELGFYLDVVEHGGYVLQIARQYQAKGLAMRYKNALGGVWGSWVYYTSQLDVVANQARQVLDNANFNDFGVMGRYYINQVKTFSNGPWTSGSASRSRYGFLEVITGIGGMKIQTIYDFDGSTYRRTFAGSPLKWYPWTKVSATAVTTA